MCFPPPEVPKGQKRETAPDRSGTHFQPDENRCFDVYYYLHGEQRHRSRVDRREWKQHGKSGIWVSNWLPHIAGCVDDLAVIRSCWGDGLNHANGVGQMNTGSILGGRPSIGSWVNYGLGTVNQNLPAFTVLCNNRSNVVGGPRNWGAGFMPAAYQGVRLGAASEPFPNLNPPRGISEEPSPGAVTYRRGRAGRQIPGRPFRLFAQVGCSQSVEVERTRHADFANCCHRQPKIARS